MDARDLESLLRKNGFVLVSQKGSHRKWRSPATRIQLIVPVHGGRVLPAGTLYAILKNSGIPEEEWRE
jgi:predicted RNA binding protein YcfA (HicA-like mRNA interferase family)